MPEQEYIMDQISTAELLGRIDERTKTTASALTALDVKIDGYGERLGRVESAIESFTPVKKVVYAAIGVILTAILLSLIAFVVLTPQAIRQTMQQVESNR